MVFTSKIHGELKYEENDIFTFEKGILGFDEINKFIIVDLKEYEPFKILQSLEDEEIGLIVTSPFEFYENYEIKLTKETIDRLKIENEKDVLLLTTVTLNSDPKKISTNLKAPLIINSCNNIGEQIIIDNSKYNIKHPLIKE